MSRRNYLCIFCLLLTFTASTQPPPSKTVAAKAPKIVHDDNKVYIFPAVPAEYPGGEDSFQKFLQENLDKKVPITKKAPAGNYVVKVRCIIGYLGNLDVVSPESRFGYGMEQEVVRVLKKTTRWIPGKHDGRPVTSMKMISVTFSVPAG